MIEENINENWTLLKLNRFNKLFIMNGPVYRILFYNDKLLA